MFKLEETNDELSDKDDRFVVSFISRRPNQCPRKATKKLSALRTLFNLTRTISSVSQNRDDLAAVRALNW